MRYGHLGPTVARRVEHGAVTCAWSHHEVPIAECEGCRRLVAFERREPTLLVHCRCPQSDAVNDPAWWDAV